MNIENELKRAIKTERHCQQRLCYWRQRRKELEKLIEQESPFDEFLGDLWDNLDNDKKIDKRQ